METELPARLAGLLDPAAYPHPSGSIELIQTPISWVFLTGEFAYKIKRPVHLPFADFRELDRRAELCREEVRLNRRFAPELYLDVCPVVADAGRARMSGGGETIEYAVRMRQFRADEELDRLLAAGIGAEPLREFAAALARIHATLPIAGTEEAWGNPAAIRDVVIANLAQCREAGAGLGTDDSLRELRRELEARLTGAAALMTARKAAGRVRECHGDLHTRNVVRWESRLLPFDCLEFEPAFRWIDVADEIAFLFMDLGAEGCPHHAHAFLDGYLAASGDFEACRLLDLYAAHRALVRAKVTALGIADAASEAARDRLRQRHLRYVAGARQALERPPPALVLMSGFSGSGKTWLARRLAPRLGAIHIRSDVERKRLAGLPELGRSGLGIAQGLYSEEQSARLYEHLAECATHVLAGGHSVIVDASFLRRRDRERLRAVAAMSAVPALIVRCEAPPEILRARIAERLRGNADASEAGPDVLEWQRTHAEPPGADEDAAVIVADTSRADVVEDMLARLAR